jgi:FMN-dependent NADH-azoreductase
MPTLLHLDSSFQAENSVSRQVSGAFAEHWRAANPDGDYRYRDLAADPLPHYDATAHAAAATPAAEHTPEQQAAWAVTTSLTDELEAADVVLLGVPMYNFTIPSTFKAWLDRIVQGKYFAGADGRGLLSDKQFVVTAARGGSYAPGTPREDFEFQERYLRAIFGNLGIRDNLTFVTTEMTLAKVNPALAQFIELGEQSLADAHRAVRELATSGAAVNA